MYVLAFAALGVILLVGVGAVFAFGGGGSSNASGGLIQTGSCTEEEFKGLPPAHLQNPDAPVKYNSFPPSSGPHYAQPAPWGVYPDSIKQTILVHNLEHGGVVDPVRARDQQGRRRRAAILRPGRSVRAHRRSLRETEGQDRRDGLERARVRPEPGREPQQGEPGHGYVLTCTKFDKGALSKFRDKRRNKSGERYASVKDMAPGQ